MSEPSSVDRPYRGRCSAAIVLLLSLAMVPAGATDKALVADGSSVLTAGNINLNITNWGLIGSRYSNPSTYSSAPSLQWPSGSGQEYLFAAGIWVGARRHGIVSVSSGQPESEFHPPSGVENVMYESRSRMVVRPPGAHGVAGTPGDLPGGDDDGDGLVDEDPPDGRDQDGDGLVDEDFAQRGAQMFSCIMRDDGALTRQMYPDHRPLGLRVHQTACAWDEPGYENIVGLRFVVTNASDEPLEDVFVGILVDGDVGRHNDPAAGMDDLAGVFTGLARQPEGYFEDYAYAWMHDADAGSPLPGWLGVAIDGSGFGDPTAVRPEHFGPHALRLLNVNFDGSYVGMLADDGDRYQILSRAGYDRDAHERHPDNYVLVLSVGPYTRLESGQHVVVDVALTVAVGPEALMSQMRTVRDVTEGRWYDADHRFASGSRGRETLVCAEDYYHDWRSPRNPIYQRFVGFWNEACKPPRMLAFRYDSSMFSWYPERQKHCVWVNIDNCDECRRYYGRDCTVFGNEGAAPCSQSTPRALGACTGVGGRETRLPWTSGMSLPPSPWVRLVERDRAMEIYWDDSSEWQPDEASGDYDFEAYRVWRADNWDRPAGTSEQTGPAMISWSVRGEYDRINYYRAGPENLRVPFGHNVGLEQLHYRPVCLDDPRFAGLATAMDRVVQADVTGRWKERPLLRDNVGEPIEGLEELLPWEAYPSVLDTFFNVVARDAPLGVSKRAVQYYRYRDEDVHNGFLYFYTVTATDHEIANNGVDIAGPGSGRLPGGSFVVGRPRPSAASGDEKREIFVYPNPATREALDEFQAMGPVADDPTGIRVAFANLPRCLSRITIYTLAGDLVQTIEHDGSTGNGQAYWNLISRNGQEIVSGIYLYVVQPQVGGYDDFVGKLVVVR